MEWSSAFRCWGGWVGGSEMRELVRDDLGDEQLGEAEHLHPDVLDDGRLGSRELLGEGPELSDLVDFIGA